MILEEYTQYAVQAAHQSDETRHTFMFNCKMRSHCALLLLYDPCPALCFKPSGSV
jgi:hypothetical protein